MPICGLTVYHKKFGQGIISCCENKVLTVVFSNLDISVQTKKFVFPDVFLNKQLETSDSRIKEYIQKYIQMHTCSICGRKNVSTTEVDSKQLCKLCEEKYSKKCEQCNQYHLKENFSSLRVLEHPYYISMCNDCHAHYVYNCEYCKRSFFSHTPMRSSDGKIYCDRCYQKLLKTCDICEEEYWGQQGKAIRSNGKYIQLCPNCIQQKTVICRECDQYVLKEDIVKSKYIPVEKNICNSCVDCCSLCGEMVDKEHSCTYFHKTYCKDCESTQKVECKICGEEFISEEESQHLCPECIDSVAYIQNLRELDFSTQCAKVMSVYSLDNMDRCKLFTNLYENCRSLYTGRAPFNEDAPFHYLVMSIPGYETIVTYLPKEITARVKCSANVTMTELRSQQGRFKVNGIIARWLEESDQTLTISEGEVQLLYYPVLIRAQTYYDKVYGKEWNGPNDYIEIGNYGDTTNFYIIGVLK